VPNARLSEQCSYYSSYHLGLIGSFAGIEPAHLPAILPHLASLKVGIAAILFFGEKQQYPAIANFLSSDRLCSAAILRCYRNLKQTCRVPVVLWQG
jgi:hypothetical protein